MMKRFTNQSNGSHVGRMYNGGAIIRRFALVPLMLLMLLLLPAGMVAQTEASSSKYIATYESDTETLTFKENVGETLPENSAWVKDKQTVADINNNLGNGTIVHIVFDKSFRTYTPTSLYSFFGNLTNLETITGLEYLNTEKVTDMNRMFYSCKSLTSLDVTHFNTANVTDMSYMFSLCRSLKSLDVTHFNTANVTNMISMFSACRSLTSLDVTHFNTANVTNMYNMFWSCTHLKSLDVTHFNTANVTDMSSMFYSCNSLTSLDVTNFNTEKVTNMRSMFYDCSALTSLYVTNFNTANVTDMSFMFYNCASLTTIYASSKFVTTKVSNSKEMFNYCEKLKGEEVRYTDKATDKTYAKIEGGYFSSVAVRPWVKYADGTLTFYNSPKETLRENEYELNKGMESPAWLANKDVITKVVFDPTFANARPTTCKDWFKGCMKLTNIEGIKYLNTSQVTDMQFMFYTCLRLQTPDFSGFDTQKVTNMYNMFNSCYSFESLDISNFNTSEVTNMSYMFSNCDALTSLDLSHFNTAKVFDMSSMFNHCSELLSVNLSGFDTRKVRYTEDMFNFCSSLKTLDLSSFDTREKVGYLKMRGMFSDCRSLTTIFVSDKFVIGADDKGDAMFYRCNKLKGANAFNDDKPQSGIVFANYKTGYFTKLVGKNGDEKIGATGETLATDNLVLDDDKDFVAYEPFAAKAASYNRTMKEGTTWATLCLPFEVSLDGQNFRAFKLLSADDVTGTVELEEIEGSIAAGTPVIIKMKDGATKLNFTVANKEIAKDVQTAETANGNYQLQGLYTQKEFSKDTDNNCYIVKGDKLMNPAKLLDKTTTESVGSKPFRAYMVDNSSASAAGARMFSISVGGSTTAIEQLETTADSKAEYYDLQGHRLQDLQKGVNIVKRGGKTMKVIIK